MANELFNIIKENSIRVYTGMPVVYPQFKRETTLDIEDLLTKFNGCYATNNSTIAFVFDGQMYVSPWTSTIQRALDSLELRKSYFFVPFSNLDYPKNEKARWEALWREAEKSYELEFIQECYDYCDEHNIGTLDDVILDQCFEIDKGGIEVSKFGYTSKISPHITSTFLDCVACERIGKYDYNNGKVVFVYRDGKTYVAKGYRIIDFLKEAGYTRSGLFVPFSNGEEIVDRSKRTRWEALTKVS